MHIIGQLIALIELKEGPNLRELNEGIFYFTLNDFLWLGVFLKE